MISPFPSKSTTLKKLIKNSSTSILRESHRGFIRLFPENTIPAFEAAVKTGADRIEMDLRLSSDGKMVIVHDETVDRTTNGQGFVHNLSLDKLKKLDAGSWKSSDFKGLTIPTLEEAFNVAKGNCFVNIDLKDANETFLHESKLHGLSVAVWGVLEENDMLTLIELGVDSIMTDNLDLLNKALLKTTVIKIFNLNRIISYIVVPGIFPGIFKIRTLFCG